MRFLILLAWGLFATAASSQTTPQTPVTEQVTVTVYGPWTHGFRTSDNAEAHLREHPNVYVKSAATAVGSEMDGRPISSKLVSIEFKSKGDSSHFPFKARAKVEVTLAPWKINIPKDVAKAEAAAEASGAKPIENELDQRIAELEALDAEMSDAVVDKLTTDLLDKINDIDVMRNTLVSVIARLTSKGPALGLWKGGKTAHRYISRLEETVARVQQVEASLTSLHDHSMLKASSLFDGLMQDLDALDSEIGVQSTWGDGDPDVAAFWEAKHALRDAVKTAEKQALSYDIGMSNEQYASTFRALKRQDKINELRKSDFLKREYGIDPGKENATAPATAETPEADQASKARDRLKSRLSPALSPEALQDDPTEDPPEAALMRKAKKQSPLRTSSQSGAVSEIRRQAGADTDTRTMDAEGAGPNQSRQDKETAPRVETPRPASPFDLARQEKERAAQKLQVEETTIHFQTFQKNMLEQTISQIEDTGKIVRLVLSERGFASPEVERTCMQIQHHLQTTTATEISELTTEVRSLLCIPSYNDCVSSGGYWECSPEMVEPETCSLASQELGLSKIRLMISSCSNVIVKIEDAINGIQSGKDRNDVSGCFGTNTTDDTEWLVMFANGAAGAGGDYTLALKQGKAKIATDIVPVVNEGLQEIAIHCNEMAEKPQDSVGSVTVFLENEVSANLLQTAGSEYFGDEFVVNLHPAQIGGVDTSEMIAFARSQGLELLSESRIKELKEEIQWLNSKRP